MTWYVIDGMDGSGKSTAGTILRELLESKGRSVLSITHPTHDRLMGRIASKFLHMDGGRFWEMLSAVFYVFDVLTSLFHVRRHRKEYDDVIFIRYSMAVAYVPASLVPITSRIVEAVLPVPDVKILMDIDPDVAFSRIESRGESLELFETPDRLRRTRGKIMMIADGWNIIDNTKSDVELRERIMEMLCDMEDAG